MSRGLGDVYKRQVNTNVQVVTSVNAAANNVTRIVGVAASDVSSRVRTLMSQLRTAVDTAKRAAAAAARAVRRRISYGIGSGSKYQIGGEIPDTGKYTLHGGELIIPRWRVVDALAKMSSTDSTGILVVRKLI